jgi:hypothetical protein
MRNMRCICRTCCVMRCAPMSSREECPLRRLWNMKRQRLLRVCRRVMRAQVALLLALACAPAAADPACLPSCPAGTKATARGRYLSGDAATYTPGCATYCEALTPCAAPRVLILTEGGAECALRPGFAPLPPAADLDLSFALAWDARLVTPTDPTKCQNRALDPGEADLDCGGFCPAACALSAMCRLDLDCGAQAGVCVNSRCGGFLPARAVTLPLGVTPSSVALDDWNNDRRDDLLVYATQPQPALYLFPGNGDGTFRLGSQANLSALAQTLTFGALGGQPVVVATHSGGVEVIRVTPQGVLQPPASAVNINDGSAPAVAWPVHRADGDWLLTSTRDGGLRLVDSQGVTPDVSLTMEHSANAAFLTLQPTPDGLTHLITADDAGVWLHRAQGDATFAAPALLLAVTQRPASLSALSDGALIAVTFDGPTGQRVQVIPSPLASPSDPDAGVSLPIPPNAGVVSVASADLGGQTSGVTDDYALALSYGLYMRFDAAGEAISADDLIYLSHLALPTQALSGRHDLSQSLLLLHSNRTLSLLTPGGAP